MKNDWFFSNIFSCSNVIHRNIFDRFHSWFFHIFILFFIWLHVNFTLFFFIVFVVSRVITSNVFYRLDSFLSLSFFIFKIYSTGLVKLASGSYGTNIIRTCNGYCTSIWAYSKWLTVIVISYSDWLININWFPRTAW